MAGIAKPRPYRVANNAKEIFAQPMLNKGRLHLRALELPVRSHQFRCLAAAQLSIPQLDTASLVRSMRTQYSRIKMRD
jgi:hypothetical protein